MKDYIVDLNINEAATIIPCKSQGLNKSYTDHQSQLHQYVVHDLIYDYTPNFNGGYVVLVEPGPWPDLLKYDERLQDKYKGELEEFSRVAKDFIYKSMKLAFQIDPGSIGVSADNYNLRHLNQTVFSYESKINSVSITYLEEKNIIEFVNYLWIEFMKDLKKGFVKLPDEYLPNDTDIFYQVPYYGQIWAYAYNPVDLRPKEIVKYIGVFPSSNNLGDEFGQRGQNNHYMKSVSYNVVDFDRSVYPVTKKLCSAEHFDKFYQTSGLFKEFIDTCTEHNLLSSYGCGSNPTASPSQETVTMSNNNNKRENKHENKRENKAIALNLETVTIPDQYTYDSPDQNATSVVFLS